MRTSFLSGQPKVSVVKEQFLTFMENLSAEMGGARIYLKREDLNHTGAHKVNNTIGQALLAKHMGKKRVIAETGAGQHGVATATAAAVLGLSCDVYMGTEDMRRQAPNVYRMHMLGTEVREVKVGSATLKEAVSETIRDWVTNVSDTHYIIGSAVGPHPYPMMVRDFQIVLGRESRAQMLEQTGALPEMLNHVADFYDEDVDLRLTALLSWVEPVILIFVAGFVAAVLVSLYLPIFSIGSRGLPT